MANDLKAVAVAALHGHTTTVFRKQTPGRWSSFYASCSCGWTSKTWTFRSEASGSAAGHRGAVAKAQR